MTQPDRFVVGVVQSSCTEDAEANMEKAAEGVRRAAARGARIICLQELFRTRYPCQTEDTARFDLAEPVPGPSTERFGRLAAELEAVIVLPLFERRAPGLYHNTAAVLDADGELAGIYRKMNIPQDPHYYEKFYFTPGDTGFRVFHTRYARLGVLICWDQWFPEGARLAALAGAEILFFPTAIGWLAEDRSEHGAQHDAWRTVQRAHAVANGCYVAAVNRTGMEPTDGAAPGRGARAEGAGAQSGGLERSGAPRSGAPRSGAPLAEDRHQDGKPAAAGIEFWGRSFIADPFGIVLAEAGSGEEVLLAECRRSRIEAVRRDWPFLRDRRIDAYGGISSRMAQGAPDS